MGLVDQCLQIFVILIKLKSRRFLCMLPVIAALVSNLYLYGMTRSWTMLRSGTPFQIVGPNDFQEVGVVLGDTEKDGVEFSVLAESATRMSGVDFNENNLEKCNVNKNCNEKFFKLLVDRKSGKTVHYVNYSAVNNRAKLTCQIAAGRELYCPYLYYLVGVSQSRESQSNLQFQSAHAFQLKSSMEKMKKHTFNTENGQICTTDLIFPAIFPITVAVQMILVTISLNFYLTISTASCIHMLKEHGFLQIMFRRGLSVLAYWTVLWIIILLEMAVFAGVLVMAYHLQCQSYFSLYRLNQVSLCSFVQFSCMAAFVLFFTVVTSRIEISSILVCLQSFLVIIAILVNRTVLSNPNSSPYGKYVILVLPFGHMAEQVFTNLMLNKLKFIGRDRAFNLNILPASGTLLCVLILVTIYLDFVLETGSGRNLPLFFPFNRNYYILNRQSYCVLPDPKHTPMIEDHPSSEKPAIRVVGLKKLFTCFGTSVEGLSGFTGQFYQNQVTAIVGHNGAGKTTLMRILSGDCVPTSGKATVRHLPITDPVCRTHVERDIGYCPQTDALVGSLTMQDSLKLTACSHGVDWDDIQFELNNNLCALQIENKLSRLTCSLSCSDKRKVCIAMSLIGNPHVLLLDQPTQEMDYISKRRLWKLLHSYKRNRVVIISTLSMDEAESISDRMVFLSGGRSICAGSSFFFKRAFDCRFIIQIASKTEFHVPFLIRKITSKFKSVRVRSYAEADLELELPLSEDSVLPKVILEIERLSELIDEYGIAHYSLDDVFSKLKPLTHLEVESHFRSGSIGYVADDVDRMRSIQKRLHDFPLAPYQAVEKREPSALGAIASMLIAHFLQLNRCKVRLITRAVVPISLLIVLFVCAIFERRLKNEKMTIRYNLSVTTKYERNRGVCVFHHSRSFPTNRIVAAECSMMLNGKNRTNTDLNAENDTIITHALNDRQSEVGNFKSALLSNQTTEAIKKACQKATSPCPIIYSTTFCPKLPTKNNYSVYVGAYVTDENDFPMNVSMTTIELYRNTYIELMKRMITEMSSRSSSNSNLTRYNLVRPLIDTEGIADFRTTFYWLYSLFVQLILLAIMPPACMSDVIWDKQSGIMNQLMTLGLSRYKYWVCTFVNHWIQLAIVYILSTILLIAIVPAYSSPLFILGATLPTLTIGLANSLLCVYCICSIVKSNSYMWITVCTCYSLVVTFSIFLFSTSDLAVLIATIIFPQFAVSAPSYYCGRLINYSLAYFSADIDKMPSALSLMLLLGPIREALLAIVLHFVLLVILLILLENDGRIWSWCKRKTFGSAAASGDENSTEDSIVSEVHKIAINPKSEENIMEVNHLQASDANGTLVLKDLTIGLKHGEAIALLGPCGSGKGSALRAMIGEKRPVGGRVDFHMHDRWLCSETAMHQGFIGYCPKVDPLIENLTLSENLQFYSRVAGISLEHMQLLMRKFHLDAEQNTIALRAAAGVRRRLTLAIAILQSPQFIAIDQAAASVDPGGRQLLWKAIRSLATKQSGIIIATQELQEAEKLCDRICILHEGRIAALSTLNDIIQRYKRMYFLEIELEEFPNETVEIFEWRRADLIAIVQQKFTNALVIQELSCRVQFCIPIKSMGRLSTALSWLLDKKSVLQMVYFTIHYATVDQTMKAIVVHREDHLYKHHVEVTLKASALPV